MDSAEQEPRNGDGPRRSLVFQPIRPSLEALVFQRILSEQAVTEGIRCDGGISGDPKAEASEVEDMVRRAIQQTYPSAQLEQDIDYVDVHYERYDGGHHLLRARAPEHELLTFERWLKVTIDGRDVHFRGGGQAGPTEYYVRAILDEP